VEGDVNPSPETMNVVAFIRLIRLQKASGPSPRAQTNTVASFMRLPSAAQAQRPRQPPPLRALPNHQLLPRSTAARGSALTASPFPRGRQQQGHLARGIGQPLVTGNLSNEWIH
jgi:hypothetical protein